jgi:hypothetical protein
MTSSSNALSDSSLHDRATISHELALERLKANCEDFFTDDLRLMALSQNTIGIMKLTPLGISCPWYSKPSDWTQLFDSLEQRRQHTNAFSTLSDLVLNIIAEEITLLSGIQLPHQKSFADVYAAFQPLGQIAKSKKGSDGRIRRSHMMTCLVDRLFWAFQPPNTSQPTPVQFPHQSFPHNEAFSHHVDLMHTWHKKIAEVSDLLEAKKDCISSQEETNNVSLSLFNSVRTSTYGRKLNTITENFSRCALGLRALTCVSSYSLYTRIYSNSIHHRKLKIRTKMTDFLLVYCMFIGIVLHYA